MNNPQDIFIKNIQNDQIIKLGVPKLYDVTSREMKVYNIFSLETPLLTHINDVYGCNPISDALESNDDNSIIIKDRISHIIDNVISDMNNQLVIFGDYEHFLTKYIANIFKEKQNNTQICSIYENTPITTASLKHNVFMTSNRLINYIIEQYNIPNDCLFYESPFIDIYSKYDNIFDKYNDNSSYFNLEKIEDNILKNIISDDIKEYYPKYFNLYTLCHGKSIVIIDDGNLFSMIYDRLYRPLLETYNVKNCILLSVYERDFINTSMSGEFRQMWRINKCKYEKSNK